MNPNEPGISQTAIGSELRAAELKIKNAISILLFSIGEKLEGMSRKPVRRLVDAGTLRRLLHIYEGSLGRTGNTAPSSSDAIPMGSKRFALQGIEYAFL